MIHIKFLLREGIFRKGIGLTLFAGALFLAPWCVAHANVVVNEIAWMGTTSSANAEWIELANTSDSSVSLDGWKLAATDGSPSISLAGTIAGSGYFVLERTSDATLPSVTAGGIYSGSLSNSGEHLVLKDAGGSVIDDIDASGGWQAGDNTTKETMQRAGSGWLTGAPTPGLANVAPPASGGTGDTSGSSGGTNSSGAETTGGDSGGSGSDTSGSKDTPGDSSGNTGAGTETGTGTGGGAPSQDTVSGSGTGSALPVPKKASVTSVKPDPTYSARMIAPDYATAGVGIPFSVVVRQNGGRDMVRGRFEWSMGDGARYSFRENTPLQHVFYYPGDYAVTLTYFSSALKDEPDSIHRKIITVVPAALSITGTTDDNGLIIHNAAKKDIDLYGWRILSESRSIDYTLPQYTVVPKGGDLSLSSHILGFETEKGQHVTLISPLGKRVSVW